MDQITILTALSGVFTRVWNLIVDDELTEVYGYFTDEVEINLDGSYRRRMIDAKIKHPNYPNVYELWIFVPAKINADLQVLFEQKINDGVD